MPKKGFGAIIANLNGAKQKMEPGMKKPELKLPGQSFQNYQDLLKFHAITVRNVQ